MTEVAKDVTIKLGATTEINEAIEIRPALARAVHAKINLNPSIGPASQLVLVLVLGGTAVETQVEITGAVAAATTGAEIAVASRLDAMAIATGVETIQNPAIHRSLVEQLESIHPSQ